ncbi:hypothetical protein ASZ90_009152 [hydrocarbon metagenome]|uniref:Uncharacterized protein n=1 Tax=hydrocarbon metagenome TaxID=938273 RepID=A0A0W8FJL5_9ZZZZ
MKSRVRASRIRFSGLFPPGDHARLPDGASSGEGGLRGGGSPGATCSPAS